MKSVTLISKDDCHLCDVAKEAILNARKKLSFELKEMKIVPGTPEFDKYHERVPVILVDEEFAFQYKVSELQLLSALNK